MKITKLEDIKRNEYYFKPIVEEFYSSDNFNSSKILTHLIKECGRLCDSYASDLFIDWKIIEKQVNDGEIENGDKFVFGIRDHGVDHAEWVLNNINTDRYYRAVYILDFEVEEKYGDTLTRAILGKF